MTEKAATTQDKLRQARPDLVERYIDACGGQMALLISPTVGLLPDIAVNLERCSGNEFSDAFVKARGCSPGDFDLGVEDRRTPKS